MNNIFFWLNFREPLPRGVRGGRMALRLLANLLSFWSNFFLPVSGLLRR
jgi:hypothetical protein